MTFRDAGRHPASSWITPFVDLGALSKFFNVDGRDVWNPSFGVADAYLGYVRSLEGILGLLSRIDGVPAQPSGVGDSIEDEVRIEGDTFQAFIALLAKRTRLLSDKTSPPHPVMAAYVRPVLATSIVLLERADIRTEISVDEETRDLTHCLNRRSDR